MVEIMIYGLMANVKNLSPGMVILMKHLPVPFYVKQCKEITHEIFRQNI